MNDATRELQGEYRVHTAPVPIPAPGVKVSQQKRTGLPLSGAEFDKLVEGDLYVANRVIGDNRTLVIRRFSHLDRMNYPHFVLATSFGGFTSCLQEMRWPTDQEVLDHKPDVPWNYDFAVRQSGAFLTQTEFEKLQYGTLYVEEVPGHHTNICTLRSFFGFLDGRAASLTAVRTGGGISHLSRMRWPSPAEWRDQKVNVSWHQLTPYPPPDATTITDQSATTQPKVKEEVMSNATPIKTETKVQQALTSVKNDAVDAMWRTTAKQTIKSAKVPLTAFLNSQKLPSGVLGFLVAQLDTENGEAVLAMILGTAMTYVPNMGSDPKFLRLAKELRIMGMENFFSKLADIMLNPVRDQLVELIKAVPVELPTG